MKYIFYFFLVFSHLYSLAQPGSNDATFNPGDLGNGYGDGANAAVNVTAIQTDGKILIGGAFTTYSGTTSSRIARLNSDGSLDASFVTGTGFNNDVWAIAVQSDGKIIVGGYFTTYNGTNINRIIRLNSNGSIDNSFTVGTGASAFVLSASIQSDGKIVIGGGFTAYNGTTVNYLTRLNTDGTRDATFTTGTGANSQINTVKIQSDGKIVIGGGFTSYNGTTRNYIARVNSDGTLDTGFNPGTGAGASVQTLAIQSDGKIIAGGQFTTYNGTARSRIVRINTGGTIDNTFAVGTGFNNTVSSVVLQSDGKVIAGGDFSTYNGTAKVRVARINTDGSIDGTFASAVGAGTFVSSLSLQSDGKIIAGGFFTTYNSVPKNRVARINSDGSLDETFLVGSGANSFITKTLIQSDGKILIAGDFTSYNGTLVSRLARLNTDGSLDATFITGTGLNALVSAMALQSDGKIIIGGDFTSYNGTAKNYILRLNSDGTIDNSFAGTGTSSSVYALLIQSDGKIIAAGNFSTYSGTARNNIVRINTDGSIDNTFSIGSGANGIVNSLGIQSDGKILIGGNFTAFNGNSSTRIARLSATGAYDNTFNVGTGANAYVQCFAVQSDGKIIAGGNFTTYNSTTVNRIMRLNTDGSIDAAFTTGTTANNDVRVVLLQSDGKIIVGGNFTSYNGTARNRIIRLNSDGTLNTQFNVGTGANNIVRTAAIQNDKKIVIAGEFTNYRTFGRNRIARIYNCSDTYNTITVAECDSYTAPDGTVHTTSGVKTAVIPNSALCDSIITINLTIKHSSTNNISVSACNSYTAPDGTVYTSSGIKTAVIPNAAGCDSTITIDLTIKHSSTSSITVSACESYTAPDGAVYTTSGVKTSVIPNAAGCDSTITINLTIKHNSGSTISVTDCDSYTAPDGTVYTTPGIKTAVITNSAGCDSTITINLILHYSSDSTFSISSCNSYTAPDGTVYTTSGTKTAIIPNAAGCDSVITINLTILHNTNNSINVTTCDSYTAPDGTIYTTSGTKTAIIPNAAGCDSIITINLTVNHSSSSSVSITACNSYTAPDGTVYTSSGIKTAVIVNAAGCDSTITINLTINVSTSGSITATSCNSYTAPDGVVYTSSGIKTAVIANSDGCDSVITIYLTILYNSDTSLVINSCGPYTAPDGNTYFTSGQITATIANSAGCDSIINIELFIQQPFGNDQICIVSADTVLNKNRVIWEKTAGEGTESYNVYKEVSANIYNLIGNVPFNNQPVFTDMGSDPSISDYKYKITAVDTCGSESSFSNYHKTIFLDASGYGNVVNLSWTPYEDESGSFIPSRYYIHRGTQPDNTIVIDSVSGNITGYTDNNATGVFYYRISAINTSSCDTLINSAYSNTIDNSVLVNVDISDYGKDKIKIWPNPMKTAAKIEVYSSEEGVLRITDISGKVVRTVDRCGQNTDKGNRSYIIERGELKPGIYIIEFSSLEEMRTVLLVE